MSNAFLTNSYNSVIELLSTKLRSAKAISISIDRFPDVSSRSVFHAVGCKRIPFHISSFRLGLERESAFNINIKLKEVLTEFSYIYKFEKKSYYG